LEWSPLKRSDSRRQDGAGTLAVVCVDDDDDDDDDDAVRRTAI
jgi:hypothetical protein